jgi:glycosyltransferase involved in cell wall biosynthesis
MIILWVNRLMWRHPGPIINMTVHNAWSLAAQGHETHLCLSAGPLSETESDLRNFYGLEPTPHLQVHRVRSSRVPGVGGGFGVYWAAARLASRLVQRDQVAIFTRDSSFLPWLRILQLDPRIHAFYELHDFNSSLEWRSERLRTNHYREFTLERLLLPGMAGLVCITREQERIYRQVYPLSRIVSSPLGTKPMPVEDTERKRLARTLFYVGHMHGRKGVEFLSKAALKLAHRGVRIEFWGGYEKDVSRMESFARQHGVHESVKAVPFQPPVELHRALADRASLGVVMLKDDYYNRYLTCPVKALDCLSHGLPTLATDLPSVREVLGDAGTYLADDDVDGFVAEAVRLLDSPGAYADAVARVRLRALDITWQERARVLAEFARASWADERLQKPAEPA